MKKKTLTLSIFLLFSLLSFSQVSIGTGEAPHRSAMLEIVSSDKGLLMPRMTTSQRTSIENPADGLCVYDTNESRLFYYNESSGEWEKVGTETDLRSGSGSTTGKKPKNVIFMIGDGMSFAQVQAAFIESGNHLNMTSFPYTGVARTYSASSKVTDSAAAATAMSTGVKTKNGYVGMDPSGNKLENIMEVAKRNGLATGVVVTSSVTHATPAGYYAHQNSRSSNELIAADFINSNMDVCIGGGSSYFSSSLRSSIQAKGYEVITSTNYRDVLNSNSTKILALLATGHMPRVAPTSGTSRGTMLVECTTKALEILSKNEKGFIAMIEGSQIDMGGHNMNYAYMLSEMKDFDAAVGAAKEFAEKDGNTLVIVTGDHETGGLAIYVTDYFGNNNGPLKSYYSQSNVAGDHTAMPVPVFAYGPGAEEFVGFLNNTDYKSKLIKLLGL